MGTIPTTTITDGKARIRVNEADVAEWLAKLGAGWAVEGQPAAAAPAAPRAGRKPKD